MRSEICAFVVPFLINVVTAVLTLVVGVTKSSAVVFPNILAAVEVTCQPDIF